MKYHADLDYGQGGDTLIEAASLQEAVTAACGWAHAGDWPPEGCTVRVRVWAASMGPTDAEHTVLTIEAAAPDCTDVEDHEWELVGGCQENPGVYDTGGGALRAVSVCSRCGVARVAQKSYCGRDETDNYTRYRRMSGS